MSIFCTSVENDVTVGPPVGPLVGGSIKTNGAVL